MQQLSKLLLLATIALFAVSCDDGAYGYDDDDDDDGIGLVGEKSGRAFPAILPLPDGFAPEGIVSGTGNDFYVGSVGNGDIYRGDYRSGEGELFFDAPAGTQTLGLAYDQRTKYLFAAGGGTGQATIYDTRSGDTVANYDLGARFGTGFVNDVIVTKDAAYFTDSFVPQYFKIDLQRNGQPAGANAVEAIPLEGDFSFNQGQFNANGIAATPNGKQFIIVNSSAAALYLLEPGSSDAQEINLANGDVLNGDGILLQGKTLYVVQNFNNQIGVVDLANDLRSGLVNDPITSDAFRIPTTVAGKGNSLYAVNARFDVVAPGSDASGVAFEVVRVRR